MKLCDMISEKLENTNLKKKVQVARGTYTSN